MYRSRYTGGLSYAEKFENTLYFFIPKEKVEIRGKDGKADRGEPEASSLFFPPFYGAPLRAPRRAPPVMWTGGKRGLFACRYIPTGIRSQISYEEKTAGKYLQVLAPQTFSHSGTTSAVRSTWYILAGIRNNYICQSLPVERRLK
jgi:hypothetical protein